MLPRRVADPDPATRAADHVAHAILAASTEIHVAFPGGPGTSRLLARLARYRLRWEKLVAWQADERVAPDFDEARHYTRLFAALAVPARFVPIPVDPARDPSGETAARRYAELLALPPTRGVLDLVILEFGPGGESGALFPGDPALRAPQGDTLASGPWAGHRHVGLNLPALARARELVFLAEGEAGRDVAARVAAGDVAVPAGRLRHPRASIFAPA
ncbi:MAG: 6-phosphogluconolactonase [Deltaproteobacteria bacterium]|nr:6-phosphogluconolactonase [Deltaproteobacteria bacterium]